MATTQLSDAYDPLIFNQVMQETQVETNRFIQSGVMTNDQRIAQMATIGGRFGDLPFYQPLSTAEPNYSSDDNTSFATPENITSGIQVYQRAAQNKVFSTMDFTREIALEDPLGAIASRVGEVQRIITEKRLINSLSGVLADNVANDSSDMVNDIFIEDGTSATAANKISAEAIIDTKQTMGDKSGNLAVIAMHSVQFSGLEKLNLIDYIPDSQGVVGFPTYLGYRVVQDDSMPVRAGSTSGFVYTVALMATNSVAYGAGNPPNPSAIDTIESSGDGGGEEVLYTRWTDIVHPWGFAWDITAAVGPSPTWAELAAANWNRVYSSRKNVGIAFLRCN